MNSEEEGKGLVSEGEVREGVVSGERREDEEREEEEGVVRRLGRDESLVRRAGEEERGFVGKVQLVGPIWTVHPFEPV